MSEDKLEAVHFEVTVVHNFSIISVVKHMWSDVCVRGCSSGCSACQSSDVLHGKDNDSLTDFYPHVPCDRPNVGYVTPGIG